MGVCSETTTEVGKMGKKTARNTKMGKEKKSRDTCPFYIRETEMEVKGEEARNSKTSETVGS